MSFADELRQAREPGFQSRLSDEAVYQSLLDTGYRDLKDHIRDAASRSSSSIVSGEYVLDRPHFVMYGDVLQHMESIYHIFTSDGIMLQPISELKMKNGFVHTYAKISLTQCGKRLTDDLVRLGKKDDISIWFTPIFSNGNGEQTLSRFDEFERVRLKYSPAISGRAALHYRVTL